MDQKINDLLRDLGQAIADAIADSADVNENLRRVQEAGYSLYLTVDCKQEGEVEEELCRVTVEKSRSGPEPVFRINTSDLTFLRSVGIDPTRKSRRRRGTRR